MPFVRRVGRPGLIGLAARTAVVAGTASATAGAVQRHQMNKQQQQYEAQQAEAADQQAQMQAAAQQAVAQQAAAQQAAAAPTAAGGQVDMLEQLERLGQLHSQGVLSDDEFAAAKAKLLSA
jgi:Short C-terminal domain